MSAATMPAMSSGFPAISLESRPAFAFVVVLHVAAIFLLAHLIDAHRITQRPPLTVEILKAPEPEKVQRPPKPKPLPPVVEVPPKEPPPKEPPPKKLIEKEPPKEIPPEPPKPEPVKVEPPPEPVVQKPDVAPKPLPLSELPPPPKPTSPVPVTPRPVAKPEAPVVDVAQPKPVQLAPREPVQRPTPVDRPTVAPAPVMPQPVVQRPETPVIAPPPRPVSTPQVREAPPPPTRVTQAPAPVEAPRMPDPTLAIARDVPEARPVQLAPREPSQRPAINRPTAPASVAAPAEVAIAEPTPQITFLPVPPPGASAEVVDEIALGAELLRANYLSNPKPLYPAISKRLKEQGTVLLRVFVTAEGQPTKVMLKESSGYPRLDRAAEQALPGWKFVPATREDKAVDAWVIVPIKFSLSN
jgi:protein TonB